MDFQLSVGNKKEWFKFSQLVNVMVEDVKPSEYPEYESAFISYASLVWTNNQVRILTPDELDVINDNCQDQIATLILQKGGK
jgi:hypothetical protein